MPLLALFGNQDGQVLFITFYCCLLASFFVFADFSSSWQLLVETRNSKELADTYLSLHAACLLYAAMSSHLKYPCFISQMKEVAYSKICQLGQIQEHMVMSLKALQVWLAFK